MSNYDYENDSDVEQPADSTDQADESASLKGKGWDILVGGKVNPFAVGGDDPFDLTSTESSTDDEAGPFSDDAEVEKIITGDTSRDSYPSAGAADLPEDAFWDRGRGREFPEPSPQPGASDEAPPRDLSPEELGYTPAEAETSAPEPAFFTEDVVVIESETEPSPDSDEEPSEEAEPLPDVEMPSAETPVEPTPVVPEGSISDSDLDALLTEPAPTTPQPDPAVAQPAERSTLTPTPSGLSRAGAARPFSFEVHDPFVSPAPKEKDDEPDLFPNPEMAGLLLTEERITRLWDEINKLYALVVDDVRGHFNTTEEAIIDLKEARELLLAGSENYDNAEELVIQVKARLRLEEKVRQWSRTRGTWLAVYLILWFLLLILAVFVAEAGQDAVSEYVPAWILGSWLPSLFGGIGGVIGALWVLIKHIAKKRDFDPIHTPWYVVNPFMGIAMGFVTYLIIRIGGGSLSTILGIVGQTDFTTNSPVLYLLCVVIGFQQNVLWTLLDRFMNAILPDRREEEKAITDSPEAENEASDSSSGMPQG